MSEKHIKELEELVSMLKESSGQILEQGARKYLPLDRNSADDEAPEGYPASNEDGTRPRVDGNTIWINETWCYDACGCGGCASGWRDYPIDGKRFHFKNSQEGSFGFVSMTEDRSDIWRKAVDYCLTVNCIGTTDGCENVHDALVKIATLISWEVKSSTDPKVNG